jgi:hypothetical protein
MTSPYRQQIEQARQQRDAELAEAERIYAIAPAREKGRQDLAALLEAAEISAGEAFVRLHGRSSGTLRGVVFFTSTTDRRETSALAAPRAGSAAYFCLLFSRSLANSDL